MKNLTAEIEIIEFAKDIITTSTEDIQPQPPIGGGDGEWDENM